MDRKSLIIAISIILVASAVGFWYWSQRKIEPLKEKGSVETAKEVSASVPEIQTNPGQKVPEINPIDRANPFKYNNPLR